MAPRSSRKGFDPSNTASRPSVEIPMRRVSASRSSSTTASVTPSTTRSGVSTPATTDTSMIGNGEKSNYGAGGGFIKISSDSDEKPTRLQFSAKQNRKRPRPSYLEEAKIDDDDEDVKVRISRREEDGSDSSELSDVDIILGRSQKATDSSSKAYGSPGILKSSDDELDQLSSVRNSGRLNTARSYRAPSHGKGKQRATSHMENQCPGYGFLASSIEGDELAIKALYYELVECFEPEPRTMPKASARSRPVSYTPTLDFVDLQLTVDDFDFSRCRLFDQWSPEKLALLPDIFTHQMADLRAGGFQHTNSRHPSIKAEPADNGDGDDDDEDADPDYGDPLAREGSVESDLSYASGSTGHAGLARGSMQEDIQYETTRQREARIRSQKASARRKKPRVSQYERTRKALETHHPELQNVWDTLKAAQVSSHEPVAQPDGLSIKLLPFQREGLGWLKRQEASEWAGGMLADEMGMGKTIQMISLFLSDRAKPTLVIAPTVAIVQWRNEIEKYTKGFKVVLWHGANRSQDVEALAKADVVLTSYAVLESAFRKQENGFKRKGQLIKERSALHLIHWHRVVLDEAHNIKERSTNTAKGAFALQCKYRWCLSGTPLQNRVGELYSMIRFLGGDPYAFYFCKRCDCKSLHWSFSDRAHCDKCGHSPMSHTCYWNTEILKPIQKEGMEVGEGREAFGRLRILLERVMLRRTKVERADDMGLPPRTVEIRRDVFNEEEEDLYESLYTDTTRKFSTYISQGTVLNNYSNIFTLLTRMRQMANHPDLVLRSKTGAAHKLLGDNQTEAHICRLCQDVAEEPIMSKCRHVFCRECVRQYLDNDVDGGEPDCPYCHATFSINLEQEALEAPRPTDGARQGILARLDMSTWRSSTKIEALVEELTQLRADDKTIKSLVFSQFVNFLDLIAFRLQRAGFQVCRLEGNMTPEARNRTIQLFMTKPDITVFLVSLKAGGVALNLTEASRVFLMDPWWNPSVEVQAMDRIHRIGQTRPVIVKRMIIENSIEARIIELQAKKSAMIEAAIGKDDAAMGRLTVADLRFLFTL